MNAEQLTDLLPVSHSAGGSVRPGQQIERAGKTPLLRRSPRPRIGSQQCRQMAARRFSGENEPSWNYFELASFALKKLQWPQQCSSTGAGNWTAGARRYSTAAQANPAPAQYGKKAAHRRACPIPNRRRERRTISGKGPAPAGSCRSSNASVRDAYRKSAALALPNQQDR